MLSISVEHDPASGAWDVGHVMFMLIPERRECRGGPWRTATPPRYAEWQKSCACLPAGDQFAEDAAIELARVVSGVQKRCSCRQCRKALESAEWLDVAEAARLAAIAAEARERQVAIYVPERAEPVAWTEAEVAAEVDVLKAEIAAALARQDALNAARDKLAAAVPSAPVTYAGARRRYMDTGTIAGKEAMLAFVTMTEPDLEKLGSEWEPKLPAVPSRQPVITRRRAGLALLLASVMLSLTAGILPGVHLIGPLALLCLLFGTLLTGRQRARR